MYLRLIVRKINQLSKENSTAMINPTQPILNAVSCVSKNKLRSDQHR